MNLIRTFLTLSTGALAISTAISASSSPNQKTFFFEKVTKDSQVSFNNRLSDASFDYVLTTKKNSNALESVQIKVDSDKFLYLGELNRDSEAPKGVKCFNQICVLPALWHKNKHDQQFHFLEEINPRLVELKSKKQNGLSQLVRSQDPFRKILQRSNSLDDSQARTALTNIRHWDAAKLKEKLSELTGEVDVKVDDKMINIRERGSSKGRNDAISYLRSEYEALGYKVSLEDFKGRRGRKGTNIIAERKGADPSKIFVVSSHIDSVSNAGADDDGAGTITALAIAAAIKDLPLKYTIRFIGFDLEEVGLIGAREHVDNLVDAGRIDDIVGVFHLEMTGYDGDRDSAYHIVACNDRRDGPMKDIILQTVEQNGINAEYVPACTNASDHSAFWRHDRPAIVISQNFFGRDSNPCYHKRCDTVDQLDFTYMEKLTRLSTLSVIRMLVKDQ